MSWLQWTGVYFLIMGGAFSVNAQFEVLDIPISRDGSSISMPLTGGLSAPQFSNIDLNRDGNTDLLAFDRDGNIFMSFIYDADNGGFTYAPEYNEIFPEARNFVIIRDYNRDGIEDLFTFSHLPGIAGFQVFTGRESEGSLAFDPVTFGNHRDIIEYENSNGGFTNAYVSNIDKPVVEDVDGDEDMDILSWEPSGSYIYFYKNMAVERGYPFDSLVFTLDDRCWAKIFESEFSEDLFLSDNANVCSRGLMGEGDGTASPRHAGSAFGAYDISGNGLQDVLIGDIGSSKVVALFNEGTAANAFGVDQDSRYPQSSIPIEFDRFLSSYFVDITNDGREELLVAPNASGGVRNQNFIWRYDNLLPTDSPGFDPGFVQENFLEELTLDLTRHSVPAMADVNGDGLSDLLVGTQGINQSVGNLEPRLYLFLNTGTPSSPSFDLVDDDYLSMSSYSGNQHQGLAPGFGDLDGDGDVDLVLGSFSGGLFYFENTAGPDVPMEFALPVEQFADIDVGQFSIPQIIDINGDGLSDFLIGERNGNTVNGTACGNINYFENQGEIGNPTFTPDETEMPNNPCLGEVFTRRSSEFTGYSSPQLLPSDDGFLLLTGSLSRQILLYEQNGSILDPMTLVEEPLGGLIIGNRTHPRFFDITNNGTYELIVGNSRGGLNIFSTPYLVGGSTSLSNSGDGHRKFELYPNPGGDLFRILNENPSIINQVIVYSSDGVEVKRWKDSNEFDAYRLPFLPEGVYFVQIQTKNSSIVRKWVKH